MNNALSTFAVALLGGVVGTLLTLRYVEMRLLDDDDDDDEGKEDEQWQVITLNLN